MQQQQQITFDFSLLVVGFELNTIILVQSPCVVDEREILH